MRSMRLGLSLALILFLAGKCRGSTNRGRASLQTWQLGHHGSLGESEAGAD